MLDSISSPIASHCLLCTGLAGTCRSAGMLLVGMLDWRQFPIVHALCEVLPPMLLSGSTDGHAVCFQRCMLPSPSFCRAMQSAWEGTGCAQPVRRRMVRMT